MLKLFMIVMMVLALLLGANTVVLAQDDGAEPTAVVELTAEAGDETGGATGSETPGDGGLSDDAIVVVVDLLKDGQETLVGVMQQQNTITFVFVIVVVSAAIFAVYKMAASRVPLPVFEQMQTLAKEVIVTMEEEAKRRLELAKQTTTKLDDAGFGLMLSFLREMKGLVGAPLEGVPTSPGNGIEGMSEVQRMYSAWAKGMAFDPAARPETESEGLG